MVNFVIRTGVLLHVDTITDLEIFYRIIRSVNTQPTELFDNVRYVGFQIICLNETCLNGICFYHKLFKISPNTIRPVTVSSTKCSVAVPTAVLSSVGNFGTGMVYSCMTNGPGRNFHQNWPLIANHYLPLPPEYQTIRYFEIFSYNPEEPRY